jgi:hypothetical protein
VSIGNPEFSLAELAKIAKAETVKKMANCTLICLILIMNCLFTTRKKIYGLIDQIMPFLILAIWPLIMSLRYLIWQWLKRAPKAT